MKNLLVITQKVDQNDDHRGFFIDWLKEFGKKFDEVYVITVAGGTFSLPDNIHVYSLGKDRGTNKFVQAIRFYGILVRLLPKSVGVFAHASAIFVVASWPLAFVFRKKIVLWYLHRSVTFRLKLAEIMCYKIVTAAKESLKFTSDKIVETGHGIRVEEFETARDWNKKEQLKILSVGRISKIKNYETLLKAAAILKIKGIDFNVTIVGQPVMSSDTDYLNYLKSLQNELGLQKEVQFIGSVPYHQMPSLNKSADIVVGLTPNGGIDKALLEGMASGCIALTSNTVNKKYFGSYAEKLIFKHGSPESLTNKILALEELSMEEKNQISRFLVDMIKEKHNLKNLAETISKLY